MTPQLSAASNESNGIWLPLTEYSVRSGVSLSTIRRKIKNNSIRYRVEKGKYLILFQEGIQTESVPAIDIAPRENALFELDRKEDMAKESRSVDEHLAIPVIDRAVRMISEAFEHTLNEKDERLRVLERYNHELEVQINELRLLVKVLEDKFEVRY